MPKRETANGDSDRRAETWTVPVGAHGERLDRYLGRVADCSRSLAQRAIRAGDVEVERAAAKPSTLVEAGQTVLWRRADEAVAALEPEPGPLAVLHEDEAIVVVDKPAGLVVHPGAGQQEGTLAHRLLAQFPEIAGVGHPKRPGIVHRLDQDTSGVLVVARTDRAYRALSHAFAEREIDKIYAAVAHGPGRGDHGLVDVPIGRHRSHRVRMTTRADGRSAVTEYWRVASVAAAALYRIRLETGRTHQIRVHFKHVRLPLVGDPLYGEARWKGVTGRARALLREFPRPALHALQLGLRHPTSDRAVLFRAPLADDIERLWSALSGAPVPEEALLGGASEPAERPAR